MALMAAEDHLLEKGGNEKARRGSVNDVSDADDGAGFKSPRPRTMSILPSTATLLNSVIGTGILALPVAFSRVGWGLGTMVMLTCMCISGSSLVVLGLCVTEVRSCIAGSPTAPPACTSVRQVLFRCLSCSSFCVPEVASSGCYTMTHQTLCCSAALMFQVGATSYGSMMATAVGPIWGKISSIVVASHAFGVCIAYSLVIAQNMVDLLNDQGYITEPIFKGDFGTFLTNRRFWILVPTLGAVMPLCMLPNYNALRSASLTATSTMIYLSSVILIYGLVAASAGQLPVWEAGRSDCFSDGGICYEQVFGVPCDGGDSPCQDLLQVCVVQPAARLENVPHLYQLQVVDMLKLLIM
eukprot:SAG31_NODE_4797_length_2952_cov_6.463722_2_plen_354_part_00